MIQRDARVRLIRESRVIGDYAHRHAERQKTTPARSARASSVASSWRDSNYIKEGDVFEAYKIEEIARTF